MSRAFSSGFHSFTVGSFQFRYFMSEPVTSESRVDGRTIQRVVHEEITTESTSYSEGNQYARKMVMSIWRPRRLYGNRDRNVMGMRTVRDSIPDVRREFDLAVDDAFLHNAIALNGRLREIANLRVIEQF